MGDPLSVAGLVLAIPPVVAGLISLTSDYKEAKNDIQTHIGALFTIKGILEYIHSVQMMASSTDVYSFETDEFVSLLRTTKSTIEKLQESLQPKKSAFGQSIQRATWHWKKKEILERLDGLERLKTSFLMTMLGDNMNFSQAILSEVSQLREDISSDRQTREAEMADQKRTTFLERLAPVGPEPGHTHALKNCLSGTGKWFLSGPLQAWKNTTIDTAVVLWLQGKSGSGKSTLMSSAIEELKVELLQQTSTGLAYFYCSFGTLMSQRADKILASIIVQACTTLPGLYDELSAKFGSLVQQQSPPTIEVVELLQIFISHVRKLDRFYICIDAINESFELEEILEMLSTLVEQCSNIHLFVTSTHVYRDSDFGAAKIISSTMNVQSVDHDIATYIDRTISTKIKSTPLNMMVQEEIRKTIIEKSDGVFRFAESQMTRVVAQHTGRDIQRALSTMPNNLNEVYARSLGTHISDTTHRQYMRRMLLWLSFANRPLHLGELSEAIVVEDEDRDLDAYARIHDPRFLLRLSQGLVEYDESTGLVSLSHSSVKACLTSSYIQATEASDFFIEEEDAHKVILRTCLTYLRFRPFSVGLDGPDGMFDDFSLQYPLLSYAARNWPLHIRKRGKDTWDDINLLFSTRDMPGGGNYAFWLEYIAGNLPPKVVLRTAPLYYAASFGFSRLVNTLLANTEPLNLEQPGGRAGSTALQVACFRRQRRAAKLLVKAGANPFSTDGSGGSAVGGGFSSLFWARSNGWDDIVDLMIKHGVANGYKYQDKSHGKYHIELAKKVQEMSLSEMERTSGMGRYKREGT